MKLSRLLQFSFLTLALVSCASKPSRPELYPNDAYKNRAAEKRQTDIDECLKEAEAYAKTPEGEKLAKSANSGSVGTSVGLGFGTGGGVGLGFGVGSGGGYRDRLSGEEQVRRNFTNQCLVNKGYQVVGWDNG